METTPKKTGRPSSFSNELAERICDAIADGTPLSILCKEDDMPDRRTVQRWIEADKEFAAEYQFARELGADRIAMEVIAIADDTSNDTIDTRHGPMPNKEWILRSKLRCETRLRLLEKWDPRRYGNKVQAEVSGVDGGPIRAAHEVDPELKELILQRTADAALIAAKVQPPASFEGRDREV